MRTLIISYFLLIFAYCLGQENGSLTVTISTYNTENKKLKMIPEDSFKMNIGFDDNPVWVWAKHDHKLSLCDTVYSHIYGINYWDEEGNVKSLYYELDRESKKKNEIDFSNYIIKPYPGDRTLQLLGNNNDTLFLFNVLEDKNLRRKFKNKSYKRIPTVNLNNNNEKVADYDVEISLQHKYGNVYEASIISNEGINIYQFNSNKKLSDSFDISYYDLTTNRIYLLDQDSYLVKSM